MTAVLDTISSLALFGSLRQNRKILEQNEKTLLRMELENRPEFMAEYTKAVVRIEENRTPAEW